MPYKAMGGGNQVTSFWEKHNELILASIYVFAENNKDNTDVKNAIELS